MGMRKSVELYVQFILTAIFCIIFFPGMVYLTVHSALRDSVSFGYLFLATTMFSLNYLLL